LKLRLYIDEVGNSDLRASDDPNHRYLSLTGVAIRLDYVMSTVFPRLEQLKQDYFGSHPDDPVILHRKEIMRAKHPFDSLRDDAVRRSFDADLLSLLEDLDCAVFTVVVDKKEHRERYRVWQYDPYHYALKVMMERFVLWLQVNATVGDVMAESRGKKDDLRLKESYEQVYERGTEYVGAGDVQGQLTSRQLKVKPKAANVAGLQLADMIAYPSFRATLARVHREALAADFGGQIAKILERSKYYREPGTTTGNGRIEGWGRKWLP